MQQLRILIADDHDLFRIGFRYALHDSDLNADVIEARDFGQAVSILKSTEGIDLASFDLRMPGLNDPRSLAGVKLRWPKIPIVVTSAHDDRDTILDCLRQGISGYLPKRLTADELVAAIKDVLAGRIFVPSFFADLEAEELESPALATAAGGASNLAEESNAAFDPSALTPRQQDVFRLLLEGRSTKEICRELDIAEGTAKIYLAAIFRRLGARNRVEAITRAARLGFLPTTSIPR